MLDDREPELLLEIERRLLIEDPDLVGLFGPAPRPGHSDRHRGTDVIASVAGLTLCVVLLIGPRPPTVAEIATRRSAAPPLVAAGGPAYDRGPVPRLPQVCTRRTRSLPGIDHRTDALDRSQTMRQQACVRLGRVYDERTAEDGIRVLVDRLWPRGLSKERADLDEWCKQIAPSAELRKWYGHDPDRFVEFGRRYRTELDDPRRVEALAHLRALAQQRTLTLLTATRHAEISEAAVLTDLLDAGGGTDR